jgi:hypothetical protein
MVHIIGKESNIINFASNLTIFIEKGDLGYEIASFYGGKF